MPVNINPKQIINIPIGSVGLKIFYEEFILLITKQIYFHIKQKMLKMEKII